MVPYSSCIYLEFLHYSSVHDVRDFELLLVPLIRLWRLYHFMQQFLNDDIYVNNPLDFDYSKMHSQHYAIRTMYV